MTFAVAKSCAAKVLNTFPNAAITVIPAVIGASKAPRLTAAALKDNDAALAPFAAPKNPLGKTLSPKFASFNLLPVPLTV